MKSGKVRPAAKRPDAGAPQGAKPDSVLTRGMRAFESGRFEEARRLLLQVSRHQPTSIDALHLLGLLAARRGAMPEAEDWLRRCLALAPDHVIARNNLGNVMLALGRASAAEGCFRACTVLEPKYAAAWHNLGNCLRQKGSVKEAESAYRAALQHAPEYLDAYLSLGSLLRERGAFNEAERIYLDLLRCYPDHPEVSMNLGNLYRAQHRYTPALEIYERLLTQRPADIRIGLALAITLLEIGHIDRARSIIEAVQIDPARPARELISARIALFYKTGDLASLTAEVASARVLALLNPEYEHLLAELLAKQGYVVEAVRCWERILVSANPVPRRLLGSLVPNQMKLCDWRDWQRRVEALVAAIKSGDGAAVSPFNAFSLPGLDSADLLRVASAQAEQYRDWMERGPVYQRPDVASRRRLRIGYLSGDLRDHATSRLAVGVFELHDREHFEVFALALAPRDDTPISHRLSIAFEHFVDLAKLSPGEAAQAISALRIDILVDMHGYTLMSRPEIPAQRPAPIQVSWLAFPGTMGAPFIDYLIADPWVIPTEQTAYYREAIAYLPECYQPRDRQGLRAPQPTRAQLGIPETAFIFCCFNNPAKISPPLFEQWCGLLRELPQAILWLFAPEDASRNHLRQAAIRYRVDPGRLIFAGHLPQDQHMARIALADLFLDTFPYNAHTTASDALWAGVPVLTLRGETFPARVAASLLHAVGLSDLVTTSQPDYRHMAFRLASQPGLLAGLRERLLAGIDRAPLFDTRGYTRALEALYLSMWRVFVAGEAPRMIPPAAGGD